MERPSVAATVKYVSVIDELLYESQALTRNTFRPGGRAASGYWTDPSMKLSSLLAYRSVISMLSVLLLTHASIRWPIPDPEVLMPLESFRSTMSTGLGLTISPGRKLRFSRKRLTMGPCASGAAVVSVPPIRTIPVNALPSTLGAAVYPIMRAVSLLSAYAT